MSTLVSEHSHTFNPSVMGGGVGIKEEVEEVDKADELGTGGNA